MDAESRGGGGASPCSCPCPCCGLGAAPLKRRLDEDGGAVARVEIGNEAAALREALAGHQMSIQDLSLELEEERSAAASAATEAMSMILRLQHEKAETQMEARQFRLFAEEKMAHDQEEIIELEELIYKREQTLEALSFEARAYRNRLLSLGFSVDGEFAPTTEPQTPFNHSPFSQSPFTESAVGSSQFDIPSYDYPRLRCRAPVGDAAADLDKYPFGETPREQLDHLEERICQLEKMPSSNRAGSVMDKGVVGFSPRRSRHGKKFSTDGYGFRSEFGKGEEFPVVVDRGPEAGWKDDVSDRVYTVDAVHRAAENYVSTPRVALSKKNTVVEEEDEIKKLYLRLQALEADRESMKQTIISMSTDKAQMLLMKEIAQQLCKEKAQEKAQEKKVVKKTVPANRTSSPSLFKSVASLFSWTRKPPRIKYTFGQSNNTAGMLLLLDKSPRMRQRMFLTKALDQQQHATIFNHVASQAYVH